MTSQTLVRKAPITEQEYLDSSFDGPDREFVDGEIVKRAMPEVPHSESQVRLILLFHELSKQYPVRVYSELRVRIRPDLVRVPDVLLVQGERLRGLVLSTPPLLIVEIVSREDRILAVRQRLEEYHAWGVPHVWLANPWLRTLSVQDAQGLRDVPAGIIPELGNYTVTPDDLFESDD